VSTHRRPTCPQYSQLDADTASAPTTPAYLVLAERLAAPLATLDHKLITASRNAGVPLLIGN